MIDDHLNFNCAQFYAAHLSSFELREAVCSMSLLLGVTKNSPSTQNSYLREFLGVYTRFVQSMSAEGIESHARDTSRANTVVDSVSNEFNNSLSLSFDQGESQGFVQGSSQASVQGTNQGSVQGTIQGLNNSVNTVKYSKLSLKVPEISHAGFTSDSKQTAQTPAAAVNESPSADHWTKMEDELVDYLSTNHNLNAKHSSSQWGSAGYTVDEPLYLQLVLINPMRITLTFNHIKPILCKKIPTDSVPSADYNKSTTPVTSTEYDSMSHCDFDPIKEVVLEPLERKRIVIRLKLKRPGEILVNGIEYELCGTVPCAKTFTKPLALTIMPPVPVLDVKFMNIPSQMLSGEYCNSKLIVTNKGKRLMAFLGLKSSHPTFTVLLQDDYKTGKNSFTMRNDLGNVSCFLLARNLEPGTSQEFPLIIRADRAGKHCINMLFSYSSVKEPGSPEISRSLREQFELSVQQSLRINAFTRPSHVLGQYVMGLEIENLQNSYPIHVEQLTCIGNQWSLEPAGDTDLFKEPLIGKQTLYSYHKLSENSVSVSSADLIQETLVYTNSSKTGPTETTIDTATSKTATNKTSTQSTTPKSCNDISQSIPSINNHIEAHVAQRIMDFITKNQIAKNTLPMITQNCTTLCKDNQVSRLSDAMLQLTVNTRNVFKQTTCLQMYPVLKKKQINALFSIWYTDDVDILIHWQIPGTDRKGVHFLMGIHLNPEQNSIQQLLVKADLSSIKSKALFAQTAHEQRMLINYLLASSTARSSPVKVIMKSPQKTKGIKEISVQVILYNQSRLHKCLVHIDLASSSSKNKYEWRGSKSWTTRLDPKEHQSKSFTVCVALPGVFNINQWTMKVEIQEGESTSTFTQYPNLTHLLFVE